MANYSPNYNLYLPSRNDADVEVDTSLTTNFTNIDNGLANHDAQLADIPKQVDGINNTLDKLSSGTATKIVCGGDSLTYGVLANSSPIQQVPTPYPSHLQSWLQSLFSNTNVSVINSGNPGDRVDQFYPSLMQDQVYANNPDCVIFMFGANECIQNSSRETFRNTYGKMVKEVTEKGIEVIIMATHPITTGNFPQMLSTYNKIAEKIANKYNCVFVDWNAEFKNYIANRKLDVSVVMPDGVHFIDSSDYKLIADALLAKAFFVNVFDIDKFNEFYLYVGDNIQVDCPSVEIDQHYKYGYNISQGNFLKFSVYNNTDKNFYLLVNKSVTSGTINVFSNGTQLTTINLNYPKTVQDYKIPISLIDGFNFIELYASNITVSGDIIVSGVGADQTTQTLITPSNSWVVVNELETPIAIKDKNRVSLSGYISAASGGIKTDGTVLFTLPSGFAPQGTPRFNINSEGGVVQLEVETNGDVKLYGYSAAGNWLYLGGISFIVK